MSLDQFCPTIARKLTKSIVAVNYRKISDLSISQYKVSIRYINFEQINIIRKKSNTQRIHKITQSRLTFTAEIKTYAIRRISLW